MKFSKLAFLLGLLIVSTTAFAQYDDDETVQSRKTSHRKEKVSAPKASRASQKQMKQQDNFKSSVNKTTHLSKKEQAKLQAKKEKDHRERYEATRKRTQNKKTVKRMKKNEQYSYKYNSAKGKRTGSYQSAATKKRAKALEKKQDEARDRYENKDYKPGARKTTKKGKIREFVNPFKRDK
ncbi:MAG: hypothetical protein MJ198_02530 [Bacteroidales bacterium]|nr:hypothetical protein [Bacteroidales bacterium]